MFATKRCLSLKCVPLRAMPQKTQRRGYAASQTSPTKVSLDAQAASGGPTAPNDYCASMVKKLDPEAWLCSYFWPSRERAWFLAWRAFNLELHLISTTVSQPALAAIRFQFWRDAISAIWTGKTGDGKVATIPQHPVAVALGQMKEARPIQRYYLSQMIDVRAKTLSLPPASRTLEEHLTLHAPQSTSLLLGPLPLLLPPAHSQTSSVSHSLSHLSNLLTTTSLLRNLPLLLSSKRQLSLPSEICEKHGIIEEDVIRNGGEAKGFKDGCWDVGTRGMDEMITVSKELKGTGGTVVPGSVMPLFLSAVTAESYLKRLEQHDFNVFHPDLQKHDWKLAPRIWWRAQTCKL